MIVVRRLRSVSVATAVSAVIITSGCASSGLGSLPLPAPGVGSGGYTLTAIFANALNLPMHAKVKLGGADVGRMESMIARDYTAVTTLRIVDGTLIPAGSTAELRSATPLGDVFVAIKPPAMTAPGTPLLKDGDTIGLSDTSSAATVESVLSSAALLVNGGAVRNFTNIINGAGKAAGDQGQAFGELVNRSNELLTKLNARSGEIENALVETDALARSLQTRNESVSDLLSAAGPAADTLAANTGQITDIVDQLGATSRQLSKFPSIAGTDTSGHSLIGDANTIAGAWNDVALSPNTSLAALNRLVPPMIKSTTGESIAVRVDIDRLVFGSRPDPGFKGDPAFHGPMRQDWNMFIGSIKYVLWRLQERVVGTGPNSPMGQVPWTPAGPPLPPTPPAATPPSVPSGQEPPP